MRFQVFVSVCVLCGNSPLCFHRHACATTLARLPSSLPQDITKNVLVFVNNCIRMGASCLRFNSDNRMSCKAHSVFGKSFAEFIKHSYCYCFHRPPIYQYKQRNSMRFTRRRFVLNLLCVGHVTYCWRSIDCLESAI